MGYESMSGKYSSSIVLISTINKSYNDHLVTLLLNLIGE